MSSALCAGSSGADRAHDTPGVLTPNAQRECAGYSGAAAHAALLRAWNVNKDSFGAQKDLVELYAHLGMIAIAERTARLTGLRTNILVYQGRTEDARQLLRKHPKAIGANQSAYLVQERQLYYTRKRTFVEQILGSETGILSIFPRHLTWTIQIYCALEHPDAERLSQTLSAHFAEARPEKALSWEELIAGAEWRMLNDDPEGALVWIDEFTSRGHAYLPLTKEPIFAPLATHPGYSKRLAAMETNAAQLRRLIQSDLAGL